MIRQSRTFGANKSTKLVILLTFIFQSQQILACDFTPKDNRKWTYNPVVLLDAEFKNPEYKAVAEKAMSRWAQEVERLFFNQALKEKNK
jgi:hypothetical protein